VGGWPVLQRFSQMFTGDAIDVFKIRQGARNLEQSMG
jgi:hypothetical protein